MSLRSPFLVDVDFVFAHLDAPNVSIVDASWYLPAMKRDGRAEFEAGHIPGAVFFDIDAISEPGSRLPHTLASPEHFAREVGRLGIAHTDTIVVYDGAGLFSAARAWWNFHIMGAAKAVILDGGMPAWIENRLPVEAGIAPLYPKLFVPDVKENAVASFGDMQRIVESGERTIADARPYGRFTGEQPEPREGMRSGHMPGAKSVPALDLVDEAGRLKPLPELEALFAARGIDKTTPVVTTCGSGVTAATLSLALESLGHNDHQLYDGSWSEWGARDDTSINTGDS